MPPPSLLPLPPSQLSAVFYDRVLMMTIANNSPAAMVVGECLPACLPACLLGAGGGRVFAQAVHLAPRRLGRGGSPAPPYIYVHFCILHLPALCAMRYEPQFPPAPPAPRRLLFACMCRT